MDQSSVVLLVLLGRCSLRSAAATALPCWIRRAVLGERATPYDAVAGLGLDPGVDRRRTGAARRRRPGRGGRLRGRLRQRGGRPQWGERLVATYGDRPAETRSLPITYRDTGVGRRSCCRARPAQPADPPRRGAARRPGPPGRDRGPHQPAAEETAGQPGAAGQRAAREERRRIRRDGTTGSARPEQGGLQLESARLQVDRDPPARRSRSAAPASTCRTWSPTCAAWSDLRPRARRPRPRRRAAAAGRPARPARRVVAGDLGTPPAAVEVAAYRIAGEAMTNVARHAHARPARSVSTRTPEGRTALLVEVADDGTGVPPDVQAGGRPGRAPRAAAELGGRSEVTCPPTGGTVVRAWLPRGAPDDRCPPSTDDIRVVVVDDHQIVRGLASLLGPWDGSTSSAPPPTGRDAVRGRRHPARRSWSWTSRCRSSTASRRRMITGRQPEVRVVMLTMNEDDETVLQRDPGGRRRLPAEGSGADEVQTAIRAAAAGGMVFGATLAGRWRRTSPASGAGRPGRSRSRS